MADEEPKICDGIVLRICRGHTCGKSADELADAATRCIERRDLGGVVALASQSCYGRCYGGPNILVERWRNGQRSPGALLALSLGAMPEDLHFSQGTRKEDVAALIRRCLRRWDLDDDGKDGKR